MTRSVFDPTGPDDEKGRGNRFLGTQGVNSSHMPPSLQEEPAQDKELTDGEEGEVAATTDEAAQRLEAMGAPDPQVTQQLNEELDREIRGDK